jgi:hypothetical protein
LGVKKPDKSNSAFSLLTSPVPKMPPRKRAAPTSEQGAPAKKTARQDAGSDSESSGDETIKENLKRTLLRRAELWSETSGSKNLDNNYWQNTKNPKKAHEFMCICNPIKDPDEEQDNGDDNNDEGGNSSNKKCDRGKTCPCSKPASTIPSHPYSLTRAGMDKYNIAGDMANLRNPDTFGLYLYNDFGFYGAAEVVENLLRDYDEAREMEDTKQAWAVIEGTALFMVIGSGAEMGMADDGDRMRQLSEQITVMVLSMLATLQKEGHMKSDSEYKNIGWIIKLYLRLADLLREQSLIDEEPTGKRKGAFKFNVGNFELYLRKYAAEAGINIPDDKDAPGDTDVNMPNAEAEDPWNWAKSLAKYTKSYGTGAGKKRHIGGDQYDVTTMSSAERKQAAFNKKDPITPAMMKRIKVGDCLVLA